MPDDQNKPFDTAQNRPSTIDDLVKELSKSSTSQLPPLKTTVGQGPPPNLPGVKVDTKPPMPPAPLRSELPRPAQPIPPKPISPSPTPAGPPGPISMARPQPPSPPPIRPSPTASADVKALADRPAAPAKLSPIQEYKSSIRTMGEDIASIKSGQKPSGVDTPRKVTPDVPKSVLPGAPKLEASAVGPKQIVGLGQAEKGGTLPGIFKPKPLAPSGQKQVGLGQAEKTTGPLPGVPTPSKPVEPYKIPGMQPSITVPKERKGLSMTSYLLIVGILVVGGFLYWFLVLRAPAPEVVLSPTPTRTVTPTPAIKDLSNIFVGTSVNFEVVLSENIGGDFKIFVNTLIVAGGDFLKIDLVRDVDGILVPLNWLDMFDMALTVYPFGLRNNAADLATLVYGQVEMFNEDGTINFSAQNLKRAVLVARVSNASAVETMLTDWELTIADDLADYLLIDDTSKEKSINFLGNTYRGVAIRYKNFPFPNVTVDYALVKAAGQGYLVIAGSREAMYAAIDALLEQ